jgi:hypothetical protein
LFIILPVSLDWLFLVAPSVFSNIYISLNWYDIPEFVIPIMISLLEGCC